MSSINNLMICGQCGREWDDDVSNSCPACTPPRYVPLYEFGSDGKRALIYLIWERQIGAIEKIGLVCICSTREAAEKRVRGLNFWNKENLNKPTVYSMETTEIDHLFGCIEMGYDIDKDQVEDRIVRSQIGYMFDEGRVETFRKAHESDVNRIAELEEWQQEAIALLRFYHVEPINDYLNTETLAILERLIGA